MDYHKVKAHNCHPGKDTDGSCVWNRLANVGIVHARYFSYTIYSVSQGDQVGSIIPIPWVKRSLENVVQSHIADKGQKWDSKDRPLCPMPPHLAGVGRGQLAQLNPPTTLKITWGTSLTAISSMVTLFILLTFFTEISITVLICSVE